MAVTSFRKTYNILYRWFGGADGKAWCFYAKGSVAFMKRRRHRLERYIRFWSRKLPEDRNYRQLVLLARNWDKNYLEALQ